MTRGEAINWLISLSADIGKAEHQDLWHYEQALSEIKEMLESEAQLFGTWIPFACREPDEEEKEAHPEWEFVLDGKLCILKQQHGCHCQGRMRKGEKRVISDG